MKPTLNENIVVVTDLDDTLLDHDTYSFDPALATLQQLEEQKIPVIINSSKTQAEILDLRQNLNNHHPFITENGSVIYTPQNYFLNQDNNNKNYHFDEILLGTRRESIIGFLTSLPENIRSQFISFYQCSADDVMEMTGLNQEDAQNALKRDYSEPLQWLDNENSKQEFITLVNEAGFTTLQGGRFLHIMGKTNKGSATQMLKDQYKNMYQAPVTVVALGDSHNDIAMLTAADIAVVIRSKYHKPPKFTHPHKITSTLYGPEGWHECIQDIILKQKTYT